VVLLWHDTLPSDDDIRSRMTLPSRVSEGWLDQDFVQAYIVFIA
jgi:hypothetical protein